MEKSQAIFLVILIVFAITVNEIFNMMRGGEEITMDALTPRNPFQDTSAQNSPDITQSLEEKYAVQPQQSVQTQQSSNIDFDSLEHQIYIKVNQVRQQNGVGSLQLHEDLQEIAKNHSLDMANNNYYEHTNLQGQSPQDRGMPYGFERCGEVDEGDYSAKTKYLYQRSRVLYVGISENLLKTHTMYLDNFVETSIESWLGSPGHRDNILNTHYSITGVGIAENNNDIYITQTFC